MRQTGVPTSSNRRRTITRAKRNRDQENKPPWRGILLIVLCILAVFSLSSYNRMVISRLTFDHVIFHETTETAEDEHRDVCVYQAWQNKTPPLIPVEDNPSKRRRYDSLPIIAVTNPLPFTNIVIRSSFKAGSTFTKAMVDSLYATNTTRQLWLNQTHPRRPIRDHSKLISVAFLRDPIERFESMYSQLQRDDYGKIDGDWFRMKEGPDRVKTFVAAVQRRFFDEHLLPQLWFLSKTPAVSPNLTFVGRLERIQDDFAVMAENLNVPKDVVRDVQDFLLSQQLASNKKPSRARNINRHLSARDSVRLAFRGDAQANSALVDVCNIYRADYACFDPWLKAPQVCQDNWRA